MGGFRLGSIITSRLRPPTSARAVTFARRSPMAAPPTLSVQLLGGFRVLVNGQPVPESAWRQKRAAAVVKLLALEPAHRLHREQLIETLWPELEPDAAANNLRVALHRAREGLRESGARSGDILSRD